MNDSTPLRRCSKCGISKPLNKDNFYWDKSRNRLYYTCKPCHNSMTRVNARIWNKENPDRLKASVARHLANPENRKRHNDQSKLWNKNNPEKVLKAVRDYKKRNPEYRVAADHRRRARERSVPDTLTTQEWKNALTYFNFCCAYCGSQQGFWDKIEADHFVPISAINCPGTVKENMLPACRGCNASKSNTDPTVWLISRFGKRKAKQVLKQVEEYFNWLTSFQ